jgi:hypothetical protein
MPFTKDGLKPDLIINPHALPTRQTIGHLVECLIGKVCTMYGGFSDCTAFNNEGSKAATYGRLLPEVGFHSSGHDILYNGMTGEQIETEIFIGPNYYMRLKHMVKDKINYRALGPRTALTKQPVSGRANDGGLRIGEMERDSVLGHGISEFLRESMMERGDEYQIVVCNTTGALAVYNRARDLFMSPMVDGPLRFFRSETGKGFALDTMTKYGRRFSVISIPYSLKLLIQELAAINIQLRIITEDNLPQIDSMAFSDNLSRLTLNPNMTPDKLVREMERAILRGEKGVKTPDEFTEEELEEIEYQEQRKKRIDMETRRRTEEEARKVKDQDQNIKDGSPQNIKDGSPQYPQDVSPAYEPADYMPGSPNDYMPGSPSEEYEGGRGSVPNSIDDFVLGQEVHFIRSVDLGLPQNHIWRVAKKGGTLITITTDRASLTGGGMNFTNSDLLQIARADELMSRNVFASWENQRAGALLAQQQKQQQQYMMGGQSLMQNPIQPQIPQINIKMVGGNDFSKGEEGPGAEKGITVSGGTPDTAFNNLVIPTSATKMNGAGNNVSRESDNKPGKTIMGGLADFGSLVINKIM